MSSHVKSKLFKLFRKFDFVKFIYLDYHNIHNVTINARYSFTQSHMLANAHVHTNTNSVATATKPTQRKERKNRCVIHQPHRPNAWFSEIFWNIALKWYPEMKNVLEKFSSSCIDGLTDSIQFLVHFGIWFISFS